MSQTVVTSASPPGAGRSLDAAVGFTAGTAAQYAAAFSLTARVTLDSRISGGNTWNGNGNISHSGTTNAGTQLGRFCNRYGTVGVAGQFTTPLNLTMPIIQPTFDLQNDAAWNNMRFIYTICRTGLSAQATPIDAGVCFAANASSMAFTFTQSVSPTIGFGAFYDNTGALWWASRPANTPNIPAPDLFQLTTDNGLQWHELEFRFQAAQLGSDATVTVIVDGIEKLTRNWGVGTLMPTPTSFGGTMWGFGVTGGKGGTQTFVDSVYFSQIRTVAAPSFEAMF